MKKDAKFINYAHRGASEYAPENTFLSFYYGITMGANGIETDVQITKDGVAVLYHDPTLSRMTGVSGKLADFTLAELKELWVTKNGLRDKIVTLEDFLIHFSCHDLTFAIELKSEGSHKPTAELLRKYNLQEKAVVTSFIYDELVKFKKVAPEFKTGYLALKVTDETLDNMKRDQIDELCPEAYLITPETCSKWHEMGFNVRAWGVYNTDLMKSVYFSGADGMTVNFPDKLTELIKDNPRD